MWKRIRACFRCGRKGYERRKSESSAEKTQSEGDVDKYASSSQLGSDAEVKADDIKKLSVNHTSAPLAEEEETAPQENQYKETDDLAADLPEQNSETHIEPKQNYDDQNSIGPNTEPEQQDNEHEIVKTSEVQSDVPDVTVVQNQDTTQLGEEKEAVVSEEGSTIQNINIEDVTVSLSHANVQSSSGSQREAPKAVQAASCKEIQEEKITKLSNNEMESAIEDILGALDDVLEKDNSTASEIRTVGVILSATNEVPTAEPTKETQSSSTTFTSEQKELSANNSIPEIVVTEEGIEAEQQPQVESNMVLRGQAVPSNNTNNAGGSQDNSMANNNKSLDNESTCTKKPVVEQSVVTECTHTAYKGPSEKKSKRRSLILVEKFSEELSNSVMNAVLHEPERGSAMRSSREDLTRFSNILADTIVRTVLDYSKQNRNQSIESEDNSHFGTSVDTNDSEADESIQDASLAELTEDDGFCIDEHEEGVPLTSLDVYAKTLSEQIVKNVLKEEFDNNSDLDDGSSTVELYISNLTETVISNAIESVLGCTSKHTSEMDVDLESMDVLVTELVQNVLESALCRMADGVDENQGEQDQTEYKNGHIDHVNDNGMVSKNGKLQSKWLSEDDLDELYGDDLSDEDDKNDNKPDIEHEGVQADEDGQVATALTNGEKVDVAEPKATSFLRPHGSSSKKEETSVWRRSLIEDLEHDLDFDEEDSAGSGSSDEGHDDEAITPTAKVPPAPAQSSHVASSRSRLRSVDSTPALVFDNGSGFLKVGYSSDSIPKEVIPSVVGVPLRYSQDISGMEYSSRPGLVFGDMAVSKAGVLHNDYPLKADVIEKWSDIEGLWNYVLSSLMSIPDHPDFPVLLTQPALNSKKHTEKLAEIMFEKFHIPSLFIANQPALALYSMGYTSGVSFCSGFNNTQAGVVYEGHVLSHTVRQLDIAGYQLTETLKKLLMSGQGFGFRSSSQWKIVNDIKCKMAFVSTDFQADVKRYKTEANLQEPYELPDGQVIDIGSEKFGCAEILFRPQELGLTQLPAHMLIADAIHSCDEDLQELCYKSIGISGGTTQMKGFPQRLESELRQYDRKCKSLIVPEHRDLSTWLGGAIMAALPTFKEMVVNVDEYADVGARVVHSKCF